MKLFDLLNYDEYIDALAAGHIRMQDHPTYSLCILNYTEKAAYESVWNDVTRNCRGLIFDPETEDVLARPFPKFFNYGQAEAPQLDLTAPCRTFDKLDGSLGILYPRTDSSYGIATRGSFTSDQAIRGTHMLEDFTTQGWTPRADCTYLFEIIYPENRIVVDYDGAESLYLLEILNTETGEPAVDHAWDYPGSWVKEFDYETLGQALEAPVRDNAEGFVLFFPDRNERVKIKQEEYVRLHKIVTGLNARVVWQWLREGKPFAEMILDIPDEFHDWVRDTSYKLLLSFERKMLDYEENYYGIVENLNTVYGQDRWSRKDFALWIQGHEQKWAFFALLDGKDIEDSVWKELKPAADWNPLGRVLTEDNA